MQRGSVREAISVKIKRNTKKGHLRGREKGSVCIRVIKMGCRGY